MSEQRNATDSRLMIRLQAAKAVRAMALDFLAKSGTIELADPKGFLSQLNRLSESISQMESEL